MVKEKKVEHLENAAVRLTVTVAREALQDEYEGLLKGLAKTAQIKGFRKGHVPPEILERKFGESLRHETSQKVVEESLRSVFEEIDEKPLPYARPSLEGDFEFSLEKDLTYAVVYDVFPKIELGEYRGLQIEEPQVTVSEEDEQRELGALQEQNAVVMDKESGIVEAGDIVTVDYCEVDAGGNEVAETRREGFVFTQGSGYNLYKIDDDVLGMKLDERRVVTKSYPEDSAEEDLAGTTRTLAITVKAVKERKLPDLDDELAQDISEKYETLDDLKKDIRSRLERAAEARVRERKIGALVGQVVQRSTIPLPETMIRAELEQAWQRFIHQFRGANEEQVLALLQARGTTREELLAQWREGAVTRLKGQLVVGRLLELENVEASDEEVEAEIEGQASGGTATREQLREYYEKQDMLDYLRREIRERKLFDALLEESKVKKGQKVSFLDLMGSNE